MLGSKPDPDEASVASYNVACCYSKLNQVTALVSMNITTLLPLIRNAFSFAKFFLGGVHIIRPGKLGLSRLVHQLAGFYVL